MTKGLSLIPLLFLLSCSDQGQNVVVEKEEPILTDESFRVIMLLPADGATEVDRGFPCLLGFSRGIELTELQRIRVCYVGDTTSIPLFNRCFRPIMSWALLGPFLWKAGKTVEFTIPGDLKDTSGNILGQPRTIRFQTKGNPLPLLVAETNPRHMDTVSINAPGNVDGFIRFNDEVPEMHDSVLTITPRVPIYFNDLFFNDCHPEFAMKMFPIYILNPQPGILYTVTVRAGITDYDGDTLRTSYSFSFVAKN